MVHRLNLEEWMHELGGFDTIGNAHRCRAD